MFNRINKFLSKILGNSIEKSNPSYQWSTESQAGQSVHDGGNMGLESRMHDMKAEQQFNMPSYQVMEKAELTQNSMDIDDLGNTRKARRI
jgi:hypothetical protein